MDGDDRMREAVQVVEKEILHYSFRDKTLLQQALTHSSFTDSSPSYERLEFLGDAVLGLAIAEYGFLEYPDINPGQLSLLRTANIDTEKLARVAVHRKLYHHVRRNTPSLDAKVEKFALAIQHENGAVAYCQSVKAPKILADIVESIAGAVYIDCNHDLKALWGVFERLMEPIVTLETLPKYIRPTTMLYEFCHKLGKKVDIKDKWIGNKNIAEAYVNGKLMGSGSSEQTKNIAIYNAANEALQKLLLKPDPSEMETEDDDHGADEIKGAKVKLHDLCLKRKLRTPKYKIENESGPPHERKFICSVQVDTLFKTGDTRSRIKDARNSAAFIMLQSLQAQTEHSSLN